MSCCTFVNKLTGEHGKEKSLFRALDAILLPSLFVKGGRKYYSKETGGEIGIGAVSFAFSKKRVLLRVSKRCITVFYNTP
jgi:hypothetical protein